MMIQYLKLKLPVAQLDRARDSDSRGRWFDPSQVDQKESAPLAFGKHSLFLYQKKNSLSKKVGIIAL